MYELRLLPRRNQRRCLPANTDIGGVTDQDYLGVDKQYYRPSERGLEARLKELLEQAREARGRGGQ